MIVLISPPGLKITSGFQMHSPNPPIGLAYVAGTLKNAGHPYIVIDATGEGIDRVNPYPGRDDILIQGLSFDEIVARIPKQTTIVGVSCMFSSMWPMTKLLCEKIRAGFPEVLLVLGGEHGTAVPANVLQTSSVDVVVLGEGEETFVSLVDAIGDDRPLSEIKGIAFRDGDEIIDTGLSPRRRGIDDIPLPDWESFPLEGYIERNQMNGVNLGRSMPITTTRGCPYACSFCSSPGMWTRRWIPRDPKKVVDEFELYIRQYQVTNFNFQDLVTMVNRTWVIDFCQELVDRDLNITWQMPSGTRTEIMDDEVADLLYRSGCRYVSFAPESGSEEMLAIVGKQVDLDKMLRSIAIAMRHGLKLSCFFVIGFPDETRATIRETLRLIRRLAVLGVYDVGVSKFIPYPGSELFRRLQAEGKIELDERFFGSAMDFYTKYSPSYAEAISTRNLYWTMIWMFVNFYVISFVCRPLRVAKVILKAILSGEEETKYAKWFVDRLNTHRRWRKLSGEVDQNFSAD